MKISKIDVYHIAIPLLRPFETSFGVIDKRPAIIFKITCDNGIVGIGESSPLYTPLSEKEILESGLTMLKRSLATCIGLPVEDGYDILSKPEPGFPVSSLGLEGAYLDALARSKNTSLATLLGAKKNIVVAGESVGLQNTDIETIRETEEHVAAGYTRVKIKIAPGKDIESVRAVRDRFPHLELGADANAAYTGTDIEYLAQLRDFNLAFVEQPFGAHDLASHSELRRRGIRICLDESVVDAESCKRAIESGACDIVNIKPARIGGYRAAKAIHNLCVALGVTLFGGGRLETGVGKSTNAALYALPGFTEASDITPPTQYFESDIVTPAFDIREGVHAISNTPGIGVDLDEEKLKKYTVEHFEFK